MNDQSLPLPPGHIPAGTPDWRLVDARRWLEAAPARWAHPVWPALGLVVTAVWATGTAPSPPCSEADPCGPGWWGMALFGFAVMVLYWMWRQPRLALLTLIPLVPAVLLSGDALGEASGTARLAVLAAAAFAAATLVHRHGVRRHQRELAEQAAGPVRHPLPGPAGAFRRGCLSLVLGSLLLAVAGVAAWHGIAAIAEDRARAAGATPVRGKVVETDAETVTVALPEGGRRTFPTVEAYPEESTVAVLVDGDWARLVAEPYDAFDQQNILLGAGLPGLAFLTNGIDGRRRAARLRGRRLAVLRVLVREDHQNGRTWVHAADDLDALHPILHFHSLAAYKEQQEDHPEDAEGRADERADELEERAVEKVSAILGGTDPEPPLREAVLYGAPYTGAEVAFAAADEDEVHEVVVECSTTPVRPAPARSATRAGRPRAGARAGSGTPVDEIVARMSPGTGSLSWSAGKVSRGVGVVLLLIEGVAVWTMVDEGFGWHWLMLVGLPNFVGMVATALNWRVTADRRGLWAAGAWRVRHIPWDRVTSVRHAEDGIHIGTRGGNPVTLRPTGWDWLERKLGAERAAAGAVDEIGALWAEPGRRPTEDSAPAEQGMPLGPVAVALSLLWGVAALMLL